MKATLANVGISAGTISFPEYGTWRANVEIESDKVLTGKQTIKVGNVELIGDIVPGRGGISAGIAKYLVKGGLAWDRELKPRPYQSDAGVRLHTILKDIAKEIGEDERIVLPKDRPIGKWINRFGGSFTARDLLTHYVPRWWLDPSGVVQCADRNPGSVSAIHQVTGRDISRRIRHVATDDVKAFAPGLTFEGDRIVLVVVQCSRRGASLNVWGKYAP